MSKKRTQWLKSTCDNCSIEFEYYPKQHTGRFCSIKCQGEHHHNVRSRERFDRGERLQRATQKRFITERDGYACAECNIDEWQGKPISLTLDHTDGDPSNNMPSNLRLLCPNCHSQTPSFGGRNKGNGRKARGLPLN